MSKHAAAQGFSYLDVMFAIVILLIGVLGIAAAITATVVRSREAEQQLLAKQYASSSLESILSVRDIKKLGWDALANVGNGQGVFLNGPQPITTDPGLDGAVGTADDTGTIIPRFQRQITITDINDPQRPSPPNPIMIRRIDVSVFYQTSISQRVETVSTIVTNY
jgi:type II secretory pathway pseudopilin PulG